MEYIYKIDICPRDVDINMTFVFDGIPSIDEVCNALKKEREIVEDYFYKFYDMSIENVRKYGLPKLEFVNQVASTVQWYEQGVDLATDTRGYVFLQRYKVIHALN